MAMPKDVILEVPMWNPREEMIDKLKQTTPLILVAFFIGNMAAWFYWICYVTIYKYVKNLILRFKKPPLYDDVEHELNNRGQANPSSIDAPPPNYDEINFDEATEIDNETVSMRSAKSGESDLQSLRTAVGGHENDERSPDSSKATIRIRSVSNTSTYIWIF